MKLNRIIFCKFGETSSKEKETNQYDSIVSILKIKSIDFKFNFTKDRLKLCNNNYQFEADFYQPFYNKKLVIK